MPEPGDPCESSDTIAAAASGEILVCRNNVWQRVGEAAPIDAGAVPSRERAQGLVEEQRKGKRP